MYTEDICLDVNYLSRLYEVQLEEWSYIDNLNWAHNLNVAYPFMSRPQTFLRCTQLGLFGTTVNADSIFGTTIAQDFHFRGCQAAFEAGNYNFTQLSGAIESLNLRHGGKNPGVSNVVYTNGVMDIYFAFGVTEEQIGANNVHVINIPCEFSF